MTEQSGIVSTRARVGITRTPEEQAEEDAFQALFGRWAPLAPAEVRREMGNFDHPWWIIGGWAIEP